MINFTDQQIQIYFNRLRLDYYARLYLLNMNVVNYLLLDSKGYVAYKNTEGCIDLSPVSSSGRWCPTQRAGEGLSSVCHTEHLSTC